MTNNHSNVNEEPEKNNIVNKLTTLNSIYLEIILHNITLTNDYNYCKGHIQITSNHSNVNVKKNNRKNKMITINSMN